MDNISEAYGVDQAATCPAQVILALAGNLLQQVRVH